MKYINIIFLVLVSNSINPMEAERKSLASFFNVDKFTHHEDIATNLVQHCLFDKQWWYVDKDLKHEESVISACFNKDGTKLLIAESKRYQWDSGKIRLYNTDTGECVKEVKSAADDIYLLTFNHEGTQIIEHSRHKDFGGRFEVACYDMSLNCEYHFTDEARTVCCFNKTDTEMLWYQSYCNMPKVVGIFDLKTQQIVSSVSCFFYVLSAQFNSNATEIATMQQDGTLIVWDKEFTKKLLERKYDFQYGTIFFNKAGDELLMYGCSLKAYILSRKTGEILKELKHDSMVKFACFNHDDSEICTVNLEGNVQIWNCKTGKTVAQLRAAFQSRKGMCDVRSVKWNSTGNKIVASILKDVRIWARYDDCTLSQILLKTVLNVWLQLKMPSKEIDSAKKLLGCVAQELRLDEEELHAAWKSFPKHMQDAVWLSMHNKIQRYGK